MKNTALLICITLLSLTFSAHAGKSKQSPFYFGIKGGIVDADGLGDSAINMGLDLGYRHNTHISTEIEITETLIEGDTPSGNDWSADTFSVFAAFRSNTSVKLKGKIGLTNVNNDTELSFGIGVGFWAAGGLMEIEYTELDDGLDFFSVGVNYFF